MTDHGDWGGKPLFSEKDWRSGTEYGGVEGLLPPFDSAHTANMPPSEQLMVIHNIDPMDAETQPVEVLKRLA